MAKLKRIIEEWKIPKEIKPLYKRYKNLNTNEEFDFEDIIKFIKSDKELQKLIERSGLTVLFDTEDFYKYLKRTYIKYQQKPHRLSLIKNGERVRTDNTTQGLFKIMDYSDCSFPDYLPLEVYDLTNENFKKVFPNNFTQEMFKQGILNYIIKSGKIIKNNEDPLKYTNTMERSGVDSGLKWLAEKAMEKKD